MTQTPNSNQETNILGKFTSVLGLLGAALFFAGWIYRWSYFYFFQLELNTLDLPAQSGRPHHVNKTSKFSIDLKIISLTPTY
ncbi:hypothetical protein [Nostoc sp.]|uniref:hypothetical protein n=1 Tax=Nostoc sp. TaxID=1180 RepID=UPI002FF8FB26